MRADLVYKLIRYNATGDLTNYRRTVDAIIAEDKAKNHNTALIRNTELLLQRHPDGMVNLNFLSTIPKTLNSKTPLLALNDLTLTEEVRQRCEEFINEQKRADLLLEHKLEPRHKLLLIGPPGNGKTSLAEAIARALALPFYVVRYEDLISSSLGATGSNLSKIFDYIRSHPCILFLDEIDSIGKSRGDTQDDVGEMRRVVNVLLLQLDSLPSFSIVIAATNFSEILDKAIWRRFQIKMSLNPPTYNDLENWFDDFEKDKNFSFSLKQPEILDKLTGKSYADVKEFATSVYRKYILRKPEVTLEQIIQKELKA